MRRFVQSAVASLAVAAPFALAQTPVAPRVQPAEVRGLYPVEATTPEPASAGKPAPAQLEQPSIPTVPDTPKPLAPKSPAPPAAPQPPAPLAPVAPARPTSPPLTGATRTVFLPPDAPSSALPQPPRTGPLPPIPVAPGAPKPDAPKAGPPAFLPDVKPQPRADAPKVPQPKGTDGPPELPPDLRAKAGPPTPAAAPKSPAAAVNDPTARVTETGRADSWRAAAEGWRVNGWVNGGYVYNTSNPDSRFNGPYSATDRSAEPMLNQAYVTASRGLPTDGIGVGFRADALFGIDHNLAQSRGFETDRNFGQRWNGQYYGLALPQLYADIGNEALGLKLGHFYSPIGYEQLPAAGNFFYTHSYSYQFGQPFTHWGGLLHSQVTKTVSAYAGLVNGWDTFTGRRNNLNVMAGVKYEDASGLWWTSFGLVTGEELSNPAGLPGITAADGNRSRYSFLVGLTPGGANGRWEYVFHHYYGFQENGTANGNLARWYGIDQYLYYRASDKLRVGGRFEWFRDEDGTRVGLNRAANPNKAPLPGNYFALTGGLNYSPVCNFTVRPELRMDFTSDTTRRPFNDGRKAQQYLLACDLIWQF